jgi:hypothetical protein
MFELTLDLATDDQPITRSVRRLAIDHSHRWSRRDNPLCFRESAAGLAGSHRSLVTGAAVKLHRPWRALLLALPNRRREVN